MIEYPTTTPRRVLSTAVPRLGWFRRGTARLEEQTGQLLTTAVQEGVCG